MKIGKIERIEEVTAILEKGVDYEEEQLMVDALAPAQCNRILGRHDLAAIAENLGYDGCPWSGREDNGAIVVKFRKRLYV